MFLCDIIAYLMQYLFLVITVFSWMIILDILCDILSNSAHQFHNVLDYVLHRDPVIYSRKGKNEKRVVLVNILPYIMVVFTPFSYI